MGIWFAKLTGHTVDTSRSLKNPHVVASYALFFGFIGFILLVWISAFILTIVRICKKYSNIRKHDETHRTTTIDLQVVKKVVGDVRGCQSYQQADIESVELLGVSSETPAKLGIQLTGGPNVTRNGEPEIFVENVKWGSVAEGKLFPGDKIIAVVRNSFHSA